MGTLAGNARSLSCTSKFRKHGCPAQTLDASHGIFCRFNRNINTCKGQVALLRHAKWQKASAAAAAASLERSEASVPGRYIEVSSYVTMNFVDIMGPIKTSEHHSDKSDFADAAESLEMELQDQGYHVIRLVRGLPDAHHTSIVFSTVQQGESLVITAPQPISAMQEGCSYLIARTPDGKLDLRDIYVHDTDLDISGRPEVHGEVPEQPLYYQTYPWIVQFTGDRINGKMPWKRVSAPASLPLMHLYPTHQPAD